jgi:antiphage defense system Thoeris ThsB-like protein
MAENSKRHHVFISHHYADDAEVDKLTDLLRRRGKDIRNSSIRAKPANQARLDRGEVRDETIRRLLRMRISWASTVVVLIGDNTHARPWVEWEINEAYRQNKRIVGVFARGGTDADKPVALEQYASSIVGWNSECIMDAIEGTDNPFELPDGTARPPAHARQTTKC